MYNSIHSLLMRVIILSLFALFILKNSLLKAQNYQVPKNEFRATWVATVINLDWPQTGGLAPRFQKADFKNK